MECPSCGNRVNMGDQSTKVSCAYCGAQFEPTKIRSPQKFQSTESDPGNKKVDHSFQKSQSTRSDPGNKEVELSMIGYFKKVVIHNYANFKGRARRKEYWMFALSYFLLFILAMIVDSVFFGIDLEDPESVSVMPNLLMLALFIPSLSVAARRLHDIDKSVWWVLICVIPFIGPIWFLLLLCKDSDPWGNQYGPSPI